MNKTRHMATLGAVALLAFSPLLFFTEFVYDDVGLLLNNSAAAAINSWRDVLHFFIQPTRPLSNWMAGAVHWWGHGQIVYQRAVSLFLHALTVIAAYVYLRDLFRKTSDGLTDRAALGSALLFAIHPVVSEVNAIAVFRWEILGTLFLFLSGLAALRGNFFLIFFTMGLSFLCKENFIVLTPLLVLLTRRLLYQDTRKEVLLLAKMAAPWLVGLAILSRVQTPFPYQEYVGLGISSDRFQWILSINALIQSAGQMFLGSDLTLLRLSDRALLIPTLPAWAILAGLIIPATVIALLSTRRTASALCLAIAGANLYFYILLPNINIGSARYWYPSIPFVMAVVLIWASRFQLHQKTEWAIIGYAIFLLVRTEFRIFEFRSQRTIAEAEASHHPDVEFTWMALLHLYEKLPAPERLSAAVLRRIDEASHHFPKNIYLRVQQMRARYAQGDQDGARRVVWEMESLSLEPTDENELRFKTLLASAHAGDCDQAKKTLTLLEQRCQLKRSPSAAVPADRCGLELGQVSLECKI